MQTGPATQIRSAASSLKPFRLLRECFPLYRRHRKLLLGSFLFPATAHLLWMLGERGFNYFRHPEWPQEALVLNADWGSSIYWTTIVLNWTGYLVCFLLAGPALVASAAIVARSFENDANAPRTGADPVPGSRSFALQAGVLVFAWGWFMAGLAASEFYAAVVLGSPQANLLVWYSLMALTFLAALPYGIWQSLRSCLAPAVMSVEGLSVRGSIKRSLRLTGGATGRILVVIGSILLVRGSLGMAIASPLRLLTHTLPALHLAATLIITQLLLALLDLLAGPLYAIAIGLFYRDLARNG